jgi:hypothetical protein
MASSILRRESFDVGPRLWALWAGLLAGPIAWSLQLETNYVLSYVACEQRASWMLHITTAAALLMVAAGAAAARRASPALSPAQDGTDDAGDASLARARSMAVGALAMCAWFAIVIIATDIPAVVLKPCTP